MLVACFSPAHLTCSPHSSPLGHRWQKHEGLERSVQYTAAGGLYISILTDQVQAVLSLVLLFVAYIYVAATFREPLGPLPSDLGTGNYTGKLSEVLLCPQNRPAKEALEASA